MTLYSMMATSFYNIRRLVKSTKPALLTNIHSKQKIIVLAVKNSFINRGIAYQKTSCSTLHKMSHLYFARAHTKVTKGMQKKATWYCSFFVCNRDHSYLGSCPRIDYFWSVVILAYFLLDGRCSSGCRRPQPSVWRPLQDFTTFIFVDDFPLMLWFWFRQDCTRRRETCAALAFSFSLLSFLVTTPLRTRFLILGLVW